MLPTVKSEFRSPSLNEARSTWRRNISLTSVGLAVVVLLSACNDSSQSNAQKASDTAAPAVSAVNAASVDTTTQLATTPVSYTPPSADVLYQMVAPIALYPDKLVALVLAGSTYPDQVGAAEVWMGQNPGLKSDALTNAANGQTWDPSIKSLTQFPNVLEQLASNMPWTTALGKAYYNDPTDVLNAIQVMRGRASKAGALKTSSQIKVKVVADSSSEQTSYVPAPDVALRALADPVIPPPMEAIEITEAAPDMVYVPRYDPAVVYGEPMPVYGGYRYAAYAPPPQPVIVGGVSTPVVAGLIGFGAGILVTETLERRPWGWHAWDMHWGDRDGRLAGWHQGNPPPPPRARPAVVYNNTTYISRSTTVVENIHRVTNNNNNNNVRITENNNSNINSNNNNALPPTRDPMSSPMPNGGHDGNHAGAFAAGAAAGVVGAGALAAARARHPDAPDSPRQGAPGMALNNHQPPSLDPGRPPLRPSNTPEGFGENRRAMMDQAAGTQRTPDPRQHAMAQPQPQPQPQPQHFNPPSQEAMLQARQQARQHDPQSQPQPVQQPPQARQRDDNQARQEQAHAQQQQQQQQQARQHADEQARQQQAQAQAQQQQQQARQHADEQARQQQMQAQAQQQQQQRAAQQQQQQAQQQQQQRQQQERMAQQQQQQQRMASARQQQEQHRQETSHAAPARHQRDEKRHQQ